MQLISLGKSPISALSFFPVPKHFRLKEAKISVNSDGIPISKRIWDQFVQHQTEVEYLLLEDYSFLLDYEPFILPGKLKCMELAVACKVDQKLQKYLTHLPKGLKILRILRENHAEKSSLSILIEILPTLVSLIEFSFRIGFLTEFKDRDIEKELNKTF